MPVMDKNIKSWSHQPKLQKSLYFLIFTKQGLHFMNFAYICKRTNKEEQLMARFINPFTDVGFKRIFGQEISKPLILDFLNSLLNGEEHRCRFPFQTRAVEI